MIRQILDLLPGVKAAKRADGSDAVDQDAIVYDGTSKRLVAKAGGSAASSPVTVNDETATIAGSRRLVAGAGTTIDTGTAGQIKVDTTPAAVGFEFGDGVTAPAVNALAGGRIPFACTITEADIWSDVSGSAVVDIQTSADGISWGSIAASAKPTLASAQSVQDTTLAGWTKTIPAGTWVRGKLESVTTCKQVNVQLKLVKS